MIAIMSKANYDKIKPVTLPSGVIIGTPTISLDGRFAMCHSFTQEDVDFLTSKGATMYDTMPSDFEVKQDEV